MHKAATKATHTQSVGAKARPAGTRNSPVKPRAVIASVTSVINWRLFSQAAARRDPTHI